MVPLCNIWKSVNTTTNVNGRALFQSYISKLFNEEVGRRYSCTAYRENGKNGTKYLLGGNAPHHIARCWGRGRRACYVNPNMSYDYVGGKR